MNNILITGANGQLGKCLQSTINGAILTDINELDITNKENVISFVKDNKIDLIINAAAYTNVEKAEDEKDIAKQINSIGPKNLAMSGAKIIHISTDYVFNGFSYKPYDTLDKADPISIYGKTKLDGEKEVAKVAKDFIIIRVSWLYSEYGNNFVKTIIKYGKEREFLNVVFDQIGSPTYAMDLALAIKNIIPKFTSENTGIYHFTNEGICSWYDFAKKIIELKNMDCHVIPIMTSEYKSKAKRPMYSILNKTKIKETFNIKIKHWEDSLKECIKKL